MFAYIGNIGIPSLILILVVVLIIFGPGKLPGIGKALGESISSFKKGVSGEEEEKPKEIE